jgi:hypothetical protein
MIRLVLALIACAGIASALPARAEIVVAGTAVANAGASSAVLDVRWHHHYHHHHHYHPHA